MKYIICPHCKDIVGAFPDVPQNCFCGKSGVLKANALDTAYTGDAIMLSCKNTQLNHLSDPTAEAGRMELWTTPKDNRHIYKSKGKDGGVRWGKERRRGRRNLRFRGHKGPARVKMEWER